MTLLNILHHPDERLHKVALPVKRIDQQINQLIDDMAQTMYGALGVGLAATQVNVQQRVIVIDVSDEKNELQVLINPEIIKQEGSASHEEGCLSVPGFHDFVTRAERVTVRAIDRNAAPLELTAEGLLAICLQHEIDHLNGKLFVQHLSQLKQTRLKNKLRKQEKIKQKQQLKKQE